VTQWIDLLDAMNDLEMLASTAAACYSSTPGQEGDSLLFPDLPASVYHADRDALSCSMLKPLLVSPAHFLTSLVHHRPSSPAQDFGSLVHILLLEPQRADSLIAVYSGVGSARDRDYKVFLAANSHKIAVDEPTFSAARRLAQKVNETCFRGRPLGRFLEESLRECSVYFTEPATGLRLRVRFDAYHPEISFDLKTTRHATQAAFARDAVDLSYDLQAYMYSAARGAYEGTSRFAPFVFITAETNAPHSVCTHLAGDTFLENGAAKFRECLVSYKACTMVDHWPDLSAHAVLEIAPWQQYTPGQAWRESAKSE